MKLGPYVSALLPSFTKNRLLADVAAMREELKVNTLPVLKTSAQLFGKRKFTDEWVKTFDTDFGKNCPIRYSGNFVSGLLALSDQVSDNLDMIEKMIGEYFAEDVLRDAITLLRVNVLQYLEVLGFVIQYSRRVLVISIGYEILAVGGESPTTAQGEIEWIKRHRDAFMHGMQIIGGKSDKTEEQLRNIPEVVANPDTVGNASATLGETKIDPLGFGFIPVKLNPIYHIRMAIAEWQNRRYQGALEERRMVEYRLMQLKLQEDGKRDAKLEENITYTQGRLNTLNAKIEKMEAEYGTV